VSWVATPLKHVVRINPETLGEDTASDREFRYIEIGATGRGKLEAEAVRMTFGEAPSRARRVLAPGDTIISTVRTYLRAVWTVTTVDGDLVASTGFACLRPSPRIDAAFLGWLAQSDGVVEEVVARSVGVSYPAINPHAIGTIKVALPSISKQRAIAGYLDRETAQIDALLERKHRTRTLLEERLETVISQATHARCAVGGAEATLPSGWQFVPLRRCLVSSNYGIGEASQSTGAVGVLGMANVDSREIVGTPSGYVTEVDADLLLRPGDLLFNRTNSRELVGKVALVRRNNEPMTFASYLVRLRVGAGVDATYLNYVLNSQEVLSVARSLALPSIGQANLNPRRYAAICIPLPPIDVQDAIVRELENTCAIVGGASDRLDMQMNLLQERRRALITAAVTGQLDIREAA